MSENKENEYPRFKPENDLNYYDGDLACIYAWHGDFKQLYNFPTDFRDKYPNFCSEYEKYWKHEKSFFIGPMHIVNYIESFAIPCVFYSNMYECEFADFDAVREWICFNWYAKYDFGEGHQKFMRQSMDGHPEVA